MSSTFHLSTSGNIFLLIAFVLVAIAGAFIFYRFTLPPVPNSKRIFLATLRSLALSLLLLLLFEPILSLVKTFQQEPTIAILLDNSLSMTLPNGAKQRKDLVIEKFSEENLKKISSKLSPKLFSFEQKAKQLRAIDSMQFNGELTNIAQSLSDVKKEMLSQNTQAILLVSDGNVTEGVNPIYEAEELGVPIFTVGLGDTVEQKDILVSKLITNNVAYAETKLPIDVSIRNVGFDNHNVQVSLLEDGKQIEQKIVSLKKEQREIPLSFSVELKNEGVKKFSVNVSSLKDELTTSNNTQTVFVNVLKSKTPIVLFAGTPTPDVAAIRQLLNEDGHFSLHTFVQKKQNEFYEGIVSQKTLDSAECFVFVNFPSSATSSQTIQQLAELFQRKQSSLFFIGGKNVDYNKLKQFQNFLPFGWNSVSASELEIFCEVENQSLSNVLLNASGTITVSTWNQLPPLYKTQTIVEAKADADVLAYSRLQTISLNEPLLLARSLNRQRTVAFVGYGMYRWRLMSGGNSSVQNFLPTFFTNAIRWLISNENDKPIRVAPTKQIFSGTEPVEFSGIVSNEQLQPLDYANIEITTTKENFSRSFVLQNIGSGKYNGTLDDLEAGDYSYSAKIKRGDIEIGKDGGKFSVGSLTVEFLKTTMDKQLLEQLAYKTGGEFATSENYNALLEKILSRNFEPKEKIQHSEIELWHWQYILYGIIFLLAMEWFVRRRSGML
ncbi:MAG: VWA domain-containing protein [Ignavibacteria bacterium]|nr:VWA domain-containing protein [Ignavibacteria bacterium]